MSAPQKVDRTINDVKFRPVGGRLVSKTTRRSMLNDSGLPENGLDMIDEVQTDENNKNEPESEDIRSMYHYSLMEDTRVSRFTHHQLLLVEKNILVLALLIIFLGVIKVEADILFISGDISDKIMLVISSTTIMLLLLVVWRRVLFQQLFIDQRRLYVRKD